MPGHPISFTSFDASELAEHGDTIEAIYAARQTGVVVRNAFPPELVEAGVAGMGTDAGWGHPNKGMRGGEIRTLGDAATPTFTYLQGPPDEVYAASSEHFPERNAAVFGRGAAALRRMMELLGCLFEGRPAAPPEWSEGRRWSAYNFRALDPGQQIFTHHDAHYPLKVYEHMPADLDRTTALSFFVTLQAPEAGGELVVYGIWGSDPNVPMLPTRFVDTAALERDFEKVHVPLAAGDLVVFDAGRHIHRVTPVEGARPRLTVGGFLTVAEDRSRLAFWA